MTEIFCTESFNVRELTEQEVPALQALFDANPEYFMAINGQPADPEDAWLEWAERPPAHMSYSRQWLLGVYSKHEPGARLLGVIVLSSDLCAEGVCHVGLFLLATALHGQGVAAPLYQALEDWARRGGARWMRLGVVRGNRRAEAFWARQGFAEMRTREGVDTGGGKLNTISVQLKALGEAGVDAYLALVPRDRPGSTLP